MLFTEPPTEELAAGRRSAPQQSLGARDHERAAARPDDERQAWLCCELTEELAAGRRSYKGEIRSYKSEGR
ncbi:hypothetical protein [Pseudoxanthomonas sp. UTMC 1351]|uniref:hypothetical protein n=1 Tax=Pseudoxanthomonas sp. UTMC 1351 TaxID=2695853 RepID=UPI0034CD6247